MYGCFACMNVHVLHVCRGQKRKLNLLGLELWLLTAMRVLGIEPESTIRTATTQNC